jgi:polyhydroxybutyrate depolymerase
VPAAYDGTRAVPVVFNFHGFGSNAEQQMAYGNFKPLADRDNFLVVAPNGQGKPLHFNLNGERGAQDDIAMVVALLDHLDATLCVDEKRVYATGMSNGGAVASILACQASDRFAAFGAVAVILFVPGCGALHPIAITAFMGTDDPVVPFDGGKVTCCGSPVIPGAPDALAGWAAFDGCAPEFTDDRIDTEVRKRTWAGCLPGGEIAFYIIDGGGHTWPGSIAVKGVGATTTQIDASATIWDFFKAHPLP